MTPTSPDPAQSASQPVSQPMPQPDEKEMTGQDEVHSKLLQLQKIVPPEAVSLVSEIIEDLYPSEGQDLSEMSDDDLNSLQQKNVPMKGFGR